MKELYIWLYNTGTDALGKKRTRTSSPQKQWVGDLMELTQLMWLEKDCSATEGLCLVSYTCQTRMLPLLTNTGRHVGEL